MGHVSEQPPIDTEQTEDPLVVMHNDVSLATHGDKLRVATFLGRLEGVQQIAGVRVDQHSAICDRPIALFYFHHFNDLIDRSN